MKLEIRNTLTDKLEIGFADSGTPPIAVILPERFQTAGGYAETRPDIETARLFAAAPELLKAVQAMVDAFGDQDSILIDQCKAALSRAEGREA